MPQTFLTVFWIEKHDVTYVIHALIPALSLIFLVPVGTSVANLHEHSKISKGISEVE